METRKAPPALVLWVLWAAFQVGIVLHYLFLAPRGAIRPSSLDGSPWWLLALVPALISMIIRWNVIPKMRDRSQLMIAMIVGIAFGELPNFLGMFIFRPHHLELFWVAFLTVLQHAPLYAGRSGDSGSPSA